MVFPFVRRLGVVSLLFLMITRAPAAQSANQALSDFLAAEWNYTLEQNPQNASSLGDHRFDDRWEDLSLAAIDAGYAHQQAALARLRAIDRAALSPANQINFDLYARNLQTDIEAHRYRFYLCPLSQQGGVQTADDVIESLRFSTLKDYQNWAARLEKLPALIEQTTTLMREGVRTKILLPKIVMGRVTAQIAKQVVDKPEDSPFFQPFKTIDTLKAGDTAATLAAFARQTVADRVIPAYRAFQEFYEKEYLPA